MKKQSYLLDIEREVSSRWDDEENYYEARIIPDKPKFMATFPYPYMNGRIHLGHAHTAGKVDFMCRFKRVMGYNVLFPFGFHCTGMPICAAAKKLENELNTIKDIEANTNEKLQYNILKYYKLSHEEICTFVDPNKWVNYFTTEGMKDIKSFNFMTDLSRSFTTTDINPFYDSFIRYQFTKLHNLGLLKHGTRHSVYSKTLDIQCQDHDRSVGEGVKIDEHKIKIFNSETDENIKFIFTVKQFYLEKNKTENILCNILLSPSSRFIKFRHDSIMYYCSYYLYQNIMEQNVLEIGENSNYIDIIEYEDDISVKIIELFKNITSVDKIKLNESIKLCSFDTVELVELFGYCVKPVVTDEHIESSRSILSEKSIHLLDDVVMDRTNNYCFVKQLPQWYINYADTEWKEKTIRLIETFSQASKEINKTLISNVNKLTEWGVSRQFGLGTRLPCDENELIDSLSDSTIYPAFYTISHLIQSNVFGKSINNVNASDFTYKVWDYIFLNSDVVPEISPTLSINIELINKMRESFNYWYPIDLRISGKDLLPNHLVMLLFNHAVCFKEKYFPRNIFANGFIMIDGVKMSKSNGNFTTVEELVGTVPIDSIRMTLGDSGDDINDANFVLKNVTDNNLLKIHDWVTHMEELHNKENVATFRTNEMMQIDMIYLDLINRQINLTLENYDNFKFRDVLINMFHSYNSLREKYKIQCELCKVKYHATIINKFSISQIILINPIIPHTTEYVWKNILEMPELIYKSDIIIEKEEYNLIQVDDWDNLSNLMNKIQSGIIKNQKKKSWILNQIIIEYNFKFNDSVFIEFVIELFQKMFKCSIQFNAQSREKYSFTFT